MTSPSFSVKLPSCNGGLGRWSSLPLARIDSQSGDRDPPAHPPRRPRRQVRREMRSGQPRGRRAGRGPRTAIGASSSFPQADFAGRRRAMSAGRMRALAEDRVCRVIRVWDSGMDRLSFNRPLRNPARKRIIENRLADRRPVDWIPNPVSQAGGLGAATQALDGIRFHPYITQIARGTTSHRRPL